MLRRFFKSIVTIVSLVSAGALLLSVLTAYFSPTLTSVVAFMGYAFPLLFVVNLLLFLFWLFKRRWQAFVPFLTIIMCWGHWENTFQWRANTVTDIQTLNKPFKVMSFNVRMLDFYNFIGKGTQNKIIELIKKENPDVLCLQEFFTHKGHKTYDENYILRRLKQYKYKHIEYRASRKGIRNFGLVTFSKHPIVEKSSLKFKGSSNFSIQTDVMVGKQRVRIFNNHLESIKFSRQQIDFLDSLNFKNEQKERLKAISSKLRHAFELRAGQAESIGRHIANSPYPPVVCGDFNDTPVSYVYRKMRGNLKDAFVESGFGLGGTYNGKLPPFRIDFIFHSNQFEAFNFERHKVDLSDHYPVSVTLDLSPSDNKEK